MLKQTPRGLVGGRISIEEVKLLQLPAKAINSLVGSYETTHSPKLLEFRVQDTVITLRNYHHDRAQNYLFGILTEETQRELANGVDWNYAEHVQDFNWQDFNWKDFIPEKLRTAWPLLDGTAQMAIAIIANEIQRGG